MIVLRFTRTSAVCSNGNWVSVSSHMLCQRLEWNQRLSSIDVRTKEWCADTKLIILFHARVDHWSFVEIVEGELNVRSAKTSLLNFSYFCSAWLKSRRFLGAIKHELEIFWRLFCEPESQELCKLSTLFQKMLISWWSVGPHWNLVHLEGSLVYWNEPSCLKKQLALLKIDNLLAPQWSFWHSIIVVGAGATGNHAWGYKWSRRSPCDGGFGERTQVSWNKNSWLV